MSFQQRSTCLFLGFALAVYGLWMWPRKGNVRQRVQPKLKNEPKNYGRFTYWKTSENISDREKQKIQNWFDYGPPVIFFLTGISLILTSILKS